MRTTMLNRMLPLLLVMAAASPTHAAMTLTAGGQVLPAADGTAGDGGRWTVYAEDAPDSTASGSIGQFVSGIWAGEVGVALQGLSVGATLVAVMRLERQPESIDHRGYTRRAWVFG